MNKKRLEKIRGKIEALRKRGGIRSSEIEAVAMGLGRARSNRGKEPTWVSTVFPGLRPIGIPHHSGDLNKITARKILEQLENDLSMYEQMIENIEEEE